MEVSTATPKSEELDRLCDPSKTTVQILRERKAILAKHSELIELSARCDQRGAMDHLEYFLSRPKFANKIPCLILFCANSPQANSDELVGAILLYEYQVAGFGCRIFVADFHGGDRTVIAPAKLRAQIASLGCGTLLARGALAVQLTYQIDLPGSKGLEPSASAKPFPPVVKGSSRWRRASTVRTMNGYIALKDSYDGTLENFGKHTRRNFRASRRYAEANLGYTFVVDPIMTKDEFLAFNRISTYPVSEELAAWRYEAVTKFSGHLLLGVRSTNGEWLSVIGGRRQQNGTYVEWQMNRADMASFSLGTLMRSHLLEHEIERGSSRLYLVGGTSHSMKYAFGTEHFVDIVTLQRALPAFLLRRFGRPLMMEGTFLVQALANPELKWEPW